MKAIPLTLALMLVVGNLQASITKTFTDGYIVCIFDRPATLINHGSKLVVGILDPSTHSWISLPRVDSSNPQGPRAFVSTDNSTDEVDSEGTLTIKKPVAIVFWNFKGGEIDVEFSVLPKSIKRLRHPPRPNEQRAYR